MSKKIIFTDAARMTWSLTADLNVVGLILETNYEPNGICVTATKGQVSMDETSKLSPFVLELDDCLSIWLTEESATKVEAFLLAHWHSETGAAA